MTSSARPIGIHSNESQSPATDLIKQELARVPRDSVLRARAFVARHQWLVSQKHWTCLRPDAEPAWTPSDFSAFVEQSRWIFARTMPQNPHEYTLRRNASNHRTFDEAVRYVRGNGVVEWYQRKPYKMLFAGAHKYWTMGAPLGSTILINRKSAVWDDGINSIKPPDGAGLVPLGKQEEILTRANCEADPDDFEFIGHLTRTVGIRIRGFWYLGIDNFVYWMRGLPETASDLHRAAMFDGGQHAPELDHGEAEMNLRTFADFPFLKSE